MAIFAMDNSAASAFVGAKAGGLLSKAFVGERRNKLYSVRTLRELYSLLFKGEVPSIPETMLAKEIEKRAETEFIGTFVKLLRNFKKPEAIFAALLHYYDYDNLKEIGLALSYGARKLPEIFNTSDFSLLNYKAFPDLEKMTAGTTLDWYKNPPKTEEQQIVDSKLDSQYIRELWKSVRALPRNERSDVAKIIGAEISYRNILWVLRLKVFYKMPSEKIAEKLAFENESLGKDDILAGEAMEILEKDSSNYDDWKNWKYSSKLNPHEDGEIWEIDPVFVEKAFKKDLDKKVSRSFHKKPMSVLSLVAWFKIKQSELDSIRRVAEGIRLGVSAEELAD